MQADDRAARMGPVKAFIILVGVVGAVVAVASLTRQTDATSAPAPTPSIATPDYSLTNAEALARFQELHETLRRASKERSLEIADSILTPDSPLQEVARRDTQQLISDGVLDKSIFETVNVQVVSNTDAEIMVEQRVIIRPHFVKEATGKNVGGNLDVILDVDWTLRRLTDRWLLHDAVVTSREKLK
ncbi:MAG TPA: hypothetical protein VE174_02545 [Actinomycetota bacterium]|nr:hypothetical protein [Actinomycetota bacterium]